MSFLTTRNDVTAAVAAAMLLASCGPPRSAPAEEAAAEPVMVAAADGEREAKLWGPDEGDHLWLFAESAEELGSGGEFHLYVDPVSHPEALASFAKFALGAGGALPVHRHDRSEEIAYFVSGEGIVTTFSGGEPREVAVGPGHVWYNPPGVWHAITNTGTEKLILVFATIPNENDGLMTFFRRVSVKPGETPPTLDMQEFARIAAEHDLILRPSGGATE